MEQVTHYLMNVSYEQTLNLDFCELSAFTREAEAAPSGGFGMLKFKFIDSQAEPGDEYLDPAINRWYVHAFTAYPQLLWYVQKPESTVLALTSILHSDEEINLTWLLQKTKQYGKRFVMDEEATHFYAWLTKIT
ncbi:hypothetical protein [Shouchella patagoniensis]|uniref:hypothetical protein n=1 Tax=Shouchella patagoniensis TaxID=228576 RepID=UPI000995482A|nr:hypothetical protein [Shouchella patagoniensis]